MTNIDDFIDKNVKFYNFSFSGNTKGEQTKIAYNSFTLAATIDTPAVLTKKAVVTLTFDLRSRNIDKDMTHIILHQIPKFHKDCLKRLGGVCELLLDAFRTILIKIWDLVQNDEGHVLIYIS